MSGAHSVTEVSRHFSEYINRVAYRGERFLLVRGNRPVAELSPVVSGRRLGELPGLLASLPGLSEEEASGFAGDIEEARENLGVVRDPWQSS